MLLVVVLASGLIAAGCGDDDDDDGTTVSVPTISVPTTATDAEEVKKQTTEAVEQAKSQAQQACIDAANQLPEPQKSQALESCQKIK